MSNKNEALRRKISEWKLNRFEAASKKREYLESKNNTENGKDSNERLSIQNEIIDMIKDGKSKMDILIYLNNKYPDSKNSIYFEKWYDYHYAKKDNERNFIKKDDIIEGR